MAYLSKTVRQKNDDGGVDGKHVKVSDVAKELSEKWKAMSEAEKEAATADYMEEFNSHREEAATRVANTSIEKFHDARATLEHIEEQAFALSGRTGTQILCFAVRSGIDQYNKPFVIATTPRFEEFAAAVLRMNLQDIALRSEAYMVSGVQGVSRNYAQSLVDLKGQIAKLIHEKLDECAGYHISKMIYANFDKRITIPHRIVVKGWPLSNFVCPSDIGAKSDLEILHNAWQTGSARFVKLTDAEYDEFCEVMATPQMLADDDSWEDIPNDASPVVDGNHPSPPTTTSPPAAAPSIPTSTTPLSASSPLPTTGASSTPTSAPTPSSTIFVPYSAVLSADGTPIETTKRKRKERSDKGVKRGPRKGKENVMPTPAPRRSATVSQSLGVSFAPSTAAEFSQPAALALPSPDLPSPSM